MTTPRDSGPLMRLERADFGSLIGALRNKGYTVLGPTEQSGAIVLDELRSVEDLPIGRTDRQTNGSYRLEQASSGSCFGYAAGPHSWKRYLFPPRLTLVHSHRSNGSLEFSAADREEPPLLAFLGVRPCDVHALKIHDRVFLSDRYGDASYEARRKRTFIIAVNCTQPSGTCFCVSMNTGPSAGSGFDLALTEVINGSEHFFLLQTGTPEGDAIAGLLNTRPATGAEQQQSRELLERAASSMGRSLNTEGLPELLSENLTHRRWDNIGRRCLACSNCTMVCPTCFCSTVIDSSDLPGDEADRTRVWDSCFTAEFSYLHGGSVRPSIKGRFRQWMTHKLSTWVDQFGTLGCVGCGRCITWCPVGIDITEEARIIREQLSAESPVSTKGN